MRNPEVCTARITMKTVLVGSTVLAAIVLLVSIVAVPRSASALPAYAAKEGKPCGYCHVNPAGGGPRNAKGKAYEENDHKF